MTEHDHPARRWPGARTVTTYFEDALHPLEAIAETVRRAISPRHTLTAALSDRRPSAGHPHLAEHPVVGGGFVATPGGWPTATCSSRGGRARTHAARRARVPLGHHVFDYTRHEWFPAPAGERARHVTGPYVDYVCTDEYVLTATPRARRREMAGVARAPTPRWRPSSS